MMNFISFTAMPVPCFVANILGDTAASDNVFIHRSARDDAQFDVLACGYPGCPQYHAWITPPGLAQTAVACQWRCFSSIQILK